VREAVISLRIGIAKALDIGRAEAKRLATDGRCVGEWDRVLTMAGVTSTNVQRFAHNDECEKYSAERGTTLGVQITWEKRAAFEGHAGGAVGACSPRGRTSLKSQVDAGVDHDQRITE